MVTPEISVRNPRATMWRYASSRARLIPTSTFGIPAATASSPQASSSPEKRCSAPGPGRTAPNLTKQQPAPASLAGPPMTGREAGKAARRLPQQYRVAQAKCCDGADLRAQIQTLVNFLGQLTARLFHGVPLALRQLRIARPGPGIPERPCRHRHDRGQKAGVETEFLIERQVHGALREGKQSGMAGAPGVELRADGL